MAVRGIAEVHHRRGELARLEAHCRARALAPAGRRARAGHRTLERSMPVAPRRRSWRLLRLRPPRRSIRTGRTARPASQTAEFPRSDPCRPRTPAGGARLAVLPPADLLATRHVTVRRTLEDARPRAAARHLTAERPLADRPDGSSGEVLLEPDRVVLIVDGRYVESAEALASHAGGLIRIERVDRPTTKLRPRSSPVPRPRPGSRPPTSPSRGTCGSRPLDRPRLGCRWSAHG
jgi:hypothetical protein